MLATPKTVLEKIRDTDIVLDVGGGVYPFARANYVLTLGAYAERREAIGGDSEYFSEKTWITQDVCDPRGFPFPEKYFDFVISSHILEDVRDPLRVCSELIRVGKRGYIEAPSREAESARGIQSIFFVGYMHHRWFIELDPSNKTLVFIPKTSLIQAYPILQCSHPKKPYLNLFWESSFSYREKFLFHEQEILNDLLRFRLEIEPKEGQRRWIAQSVQSIAKGHQIPKNFFSRVRHRLGRLAFETFFHLYR